jgi:hypothetical protein
MSRRPVRHVFGGAAFSLVHAHRVKGSEYAGYLTKTAVAAVAASILSERQHVHFQESSVLTNAEMRRVTGGAQRRLEPQLSRKL